MICAKINRKKALLKMIFKAIYMISRPLNFAAFKVGEFNLVQTRLLSVGNFA